MKIYTVMFAQDIPHYGLVDIEAKNDVDALAEAKAHWQKVSRDEEPWPLTDREYGNVF